MNLLSIACAGCTEITKHAPTTADKVVGVVVTVLTVVIFGAILSSKTMEYDPNIDG